MAINSAQLQEIRDLRNRVDWLDDERRKMSRKLTEMEQSLELQLREVDGREQRIVELETRLSSATSHISRMSQFDTQLSQFKDEVVSLIEQYDQRRIRAESEIDRLRRVEHEGLARELADVRKELPAIPRLENSVELRKAEEARLANLLGEHQNQISTLRNFVESRDQAVSYLEEKEKQNSRAIGEVKTALLESSKRWQHFRDQLDVLRTSTARYESAHTALVEEQAKTRETMKGWLEQIQLGEYERNQRIESWERELAQREDVQETYAKEWVAYSEQFNESKLAVQTLTDWQEQMEKQQREAAELLRLESQRLQARWDDYQQENDNARKNFVIEDEQRWSTVDRHERQIQEKILELDQWLANLEQQKDLLQRVQTAQADAIKRLPLLWMEEVEKAVAQNPHRRRQPALVPVREE